MSNKPALKNTIAKNTGYFESFDGTRIYYETRGQGEPLILAYGIACGANHWRHQVRAFSQKYMCVTLDYRGHHKSGTPKDRTQLSVDALARDIVLLCEHLKIKKASFWGHSFGAQILLRTYELQPELFHNMILINGFATNPIKGMFGLDAVTQTFKTFKQGYEQLPETISYLWKMNYDGKAVLDRIQVPTLIIGGDKDNVTPLAYQRTLHNNIKGSEFLVVPYGSHCTQLDMPDFVNLRIEKFLRQVDF